MIRPCIKALRQRKKLTLQQLADAVQSTVATVQRIERAEVSLVHDLLPAIADALGVHWLELFEADPAVGAGLAESAAVYAPAAGDPLGGLALGEHEAMYVARDDSLAAIGVRRGDVLICDGGRAALRDLRTGDVVVAQCTLPDGRVRTELREWIAPGLLVSNPLAGRPTVQSTATDDVAVLAVARRRFSDMRPPA